MKGLAALIKIHSFELDQKRRLLKEMEEQEADIIQRMERLEEDLLSEQEAAKGSVEGGYTYGGYARKVIDRREALRQALVEAQQRVAEARAVVADAFEVLKKYEITKDNRDASEALESRRRETMELDELGLNAHSRHRSD